MDKTELERLASEIYHKADQMRRDTKQEPSVFLPHRLAKEFSDKLCTYEAEMGTATRSLGGYPVYLRQIDYPIVGFEVPFVETWKHQITSTLPITGVINS